MNQSRTERFSTCLRRRISPFVPCLTLLLAVSASACGSSDEETTPPPVTGAGPSDTETIGRMLDGPKTCTEAKTICAKVQIPSDLEGTPESIHFVIYDSPQPPAHPPNAYAGVFPSAQVKAGEMRSFELTDGGLTGEYWLYTVVYMPGGGLFGIPLDGVDFVQASEPPTLVLDGRALNVSQPILLSRSASP